ncbi:hypothetical protein D515_04864 [Grimontia indica]|uniref:Uncharacterized protein n=2 Tax=Grimontia TaxID=246861 RepID=R1IZT3_9GAMM|nr:hypothetical protein [Grimontia kaedaensis]EOD80885.1 hypothetical protein D515_04864 [Grimontia indica]USH04944.1 hypothetical protein K6Q96_17015 [Grimontia kaedaensis]
MGKLLYKPITKFWDATFTTLGFTSMTLAWQLGDRGEILFNTRISMSGNFHITA